MAHSHNQHLTDQTPIDTNGPYCTCAACCVQRAHFMNQTSNGYPTTAQSSSWAFSRANPSGVVFMEHPTEYEAALPTTSFLNLNNPPIHSAPGFPDSISASHMHIQTIPYRGNVDIPDDGRQMEHTDIEEPSSEESPQHSLQCNWRECGSRFTFPDKKSLEQHIKTEHVSPQSVVNQQSSQGVWNCSMDDCTGTMTTRRSLLRHVVEQHINRGAYQCHLCHSLFNREINLKSHLTSRHRFTT